MKARFNKIHCWFKIDLIDTLVVIKSTKASISMWDLGHKHKILFPSRRFFMLAHNHLQLSIWNECPLSFLPCEDLGVQCHLCFCPLEWRGVGRRWPHKHSHIHVNLAFPCPASMLYILQRNTIANTNTYNLPLCEPHFPLLYVQILQIHNKLQLHMIAQCLQVTVFFSLKLTLKSTPSDIGLG